MVVYQVATVVRFAPSDLEYSDILDYLTASRPCFATLELAQAFCVKEANVAMNYMVEDEREWMLVWKYKERNDRHVGIIPGIASTTFSAFVHVVTAQET